MISTRSKTKCVSMVPRTRKKIDHLSTCIEKKRSSSGSKDAITNISENKSSDTSFTNFDTRSVPTPESTDVQIRKSKRCPQLPAKLIFDLGLFGTKEVKLKQSERLTPPRKKCKKSAVSPSRKVLQTPKVVLGTVGEERPVSSSISNNVEIVTATDSGTDSRFADDDHASINGLDKSESLNSQDGIERHSERIPVPSLSTDTCTDPSEQCLHVNASNMCDLPAQGILAGCLKPKPCNPEHGALQNDASDLTEQHSNSGKTEYSTLASTSESTLASTSESTLASTSESTLASTSESTLASTSESMLVSASEATSISTCEATLVSNSEAINEATLVSTSEVTLVSTNEANEEATSVSTCEATIVSNSEATSVSNCEATSIPNCEATSVSNCEATLVSNSEATNEAMLVSTSEVTLKSNSKATECLGLMSNIPEIVDISPNSELRQPDEMNLSLPNDIEYEHTVKKTQKTASCFDIKDLGLDMLSSSQYSKEDVAVEKKQSKIFGAVSAIVKPMELKKDDFKQLLMGVAKRTGVTPVFSNNSDSLIHGSWPAINRAYQLLQDVEKLMLQEKTSIKSIECKQSDVTVEGNKYCESDTGEMQEDELNKDAVSIDNLDSSNNTITKDSVTQLSYGCSICDKVFTDPSKLWVHTKSHKHDMKWNCQMCPKSFNAKRYLQAHLKRHNNERDHKCPICEWTFFEKHKLKLHMEKHKSVEEKNLPYQCDNCDKKFYNRTAHHDHMNTHSGDRPYTCEVCQSKFSHRVGLTRHMLVHSNEKLFKCDNCEKSFKFKDKLAAHMVQHTGVGGHRCSACQKVFTALSSLRRHKCPGMEHIILNTEETIFMCGTCGEVADTLENAQLHVLTHDDQENAAQEFIKIENEGSFINNIAALDGIHNLQLADVLHLESSGAVVEQVVEVGCTDSEKTCNSDDAIAEKHLVANTLADLSHAALT